jgi:hypothetical protein
MFFTRPLPVGLANLTGGVRADDASTMTTTFRDVLHEAVTGRSGELEAMSSELT